ncbi:MAG: UDP-3-O-(3-hydroxymyristoyl)glucosamine N-acyltransferase [Bacteroidales bacterium]|nr:UDP-3-O-(3-hydroxymyristoyl)glucosamine N-acyltransferase [Bacteroidales bacterium]
MKFTASQIAALLSGTVEGDPNKEVWNVAKIEEGSPGMLSFLANPKYTPYIYTTQSSVVIVNNDFEAKEPVAATLIRVADAYASFAKLLAFYDEMSNKKEGVSSLAFVSSTAQCGANMYLGEFAFIGEHAVLGNNVKVYPQVYVGDGCVIGDDTVLYPGVRLYRNTVVGKRCIVHAGAVLGADGFGFAPQEDGHYEKIPQVGNVVVDDDVEIGANTTIDRSTMGSTHIHRGVKLDNLVHLAHNVEVGEHTALAAQVGVSGSTHLGKHCVVGGQSGFVGHLHIADGSKFGGQCGIMGSIKEENQEFMGTPIQPLREYLRSNARFRHIDEMARKIDALEKELSDLKSKL